MNDGGGGLYLTQRILQNLLLMLDPDEYGFPYMLMLSCLTTSTNLYLLRSYQELLFLFRFNE